jgi:hypothetical protein
MLSSIVGRSAIRRVIFSGTKSDVRPGFRMDFEDWHSLEGGRDLIEVSRSIKPLDTAQGEKSTLFFFPDPTSAEVVHDAGEGSGVCAGNVFDARVCCSDLVELSGGLGSASDRKVLNLIATSAACEGNAGRAGQASELMRIASIAAMITEGTGQNAL